jgi:tetratricopeptide (TPR) repeat protein
MVSTVLMCCALLGADRAESRTTSPVRPADLAAYEEAKSKVGRDADGHVRLALWCQSHGLRPEGVKHLALAVLYDPSHALARGLLGMVSYQGKWGRPEVVGDQMEKDPAYREAIREYLNRRSRTADKAEAQQKLAAWCEEKGLKVQAQTHYERVLQLDPTRDIAWKHLGYKKQGNRWVKSDQAAEAKLEADRQKQADKHWKPILEKLRDDLQSKDAAKRARAEHELNTITDPRAVPMIWALYGFSSERAQLAAIQMLSQIDSTAASNGLAGLAIFSLRPEVQHRAYDRLVGRDLRDILTRLIGLIRQPFKYQVRPVGGPGSMGVLFVEGEKYNVQRIYRSLPVDPALMPASFFTSPRVFNTSTPATAGVNTPLMMENQINLPADNVNPYDALAAQVNATAGSSGDIQNGMRQLERVRQSNVALEQTLAQDVQAIEMINAQINILNDRVLPIVQTATGQKLGVEPDKWKDWWTDQLGYAFQASQPTFKPTFTDIVDAPVWSASSSCFAEGTIVHAAGGPKAIETITIGDRVLSQNPVTGALSYQPVMAVRLTKSASTVRVAVGGDTIVSTGIHRFWKVGNGWAMARDLKPGDRIRMVGGTVEVRSVQPDKKQTVYNLDVAENRDFFVGNQGLLVHDLSFVNQVAEPFDLEPDLATLTPSKKPTATR